MTDTNGNGRSFRSMLALCSQITTIILIPYLGWLSTTVVSNGQSIATLNSQMTNLSIVFDSIRDAIAVKTELRYRSTDAEKDFALRDLRIDELDKRLQRLEIKVLGEKGN
jgi:hypothetical protein